MDMLRNKQKAPDFTLRDANGKERSLEELREGKPLVLHFSRGKFCPTAKRDMMRFVDVYPRIKAVEAGLAVISTTPSDDNASLCKELNVKFPLLSDEDFAVSRQYGVYESDEKEEGPQPHGEPAVFILDVDGKVVYSQVQTGPKGMAPPEEIALVLVHMSQNGGRYE
jgi:peroxiredoxin